MSTIPENLFIIVPCYNEAECIVSVIKELKAHLPDAHLVIIDDASSDASVEVVKSVLDEKITLLPLATNLGIGGAVQTGFIYAALNGAEYAVKFDGDGQHPADMIATLLSPLLDDSADLVIGSRFMANNDGFKSTFLRRIGIGFFAIVNSLLLKQRIIDNTSGFRAYNRAALEFAAKYYPSFDYPEPEEVVLFAHNNFRIKEVPVSMRDRVAGSSSINLRRSAYYMIKVTFAIFMTAMRPKIRR